MYFSSAFFLTDVVEEVQGDHVEQDSFCWRIQLGILDRCALRLDIVGDRSRTPNGTICDVYERYVS